MRDPVTRVWRMTFWIPLALCMLSIGLPVARLLWLVFERRRAAAALASTSGTFESTPPLSSFEVLIDRLDKSERRGAVSAMWDVVFVGGGAACAGIAGIIALHS